MGKKLTSKGVKIALKSIVAVLSVFVMVLTSLAVFLNFRKQPPVEEIKNPIGWSVDTWDGNKQGNNTSFLSGDVFANRGEKTYTINSASSYAYFVNLTNDVDLAREYDFFKGYTIYLNKSIDLSGYEISPIGVKVQQGSEYVSTFQGTFDGGYYTISNGKINGNGVFGYVENAVIKNVGAYNIEINSTSSHAGGLVGEAINTDIENTFVRLGKITSEGSVAGLVGKFVSTNGIHTISNSFASTTLEGTEMYGIVAEIETEQDSMLSIETCYYTGEYDIYGNIDEIGNLNIYNVLINPTIEQFSAWDLYIGSYNHSTAKSKGEIVQTWCDYSYIENSRELSFDLPILTRFNKVYMTGSCYENVVVTKQGVVNAESLAEAFSLNPTNDEVNIIVPQITVDYTAVVEDEETIILNALTDITILRGEKSTGALIVSGDASNLVIGTEDSGKITIDGNSDYVAEQNFTSGPLIHAQGNSLEVNTELVLQNNINNLTSYGGGLSIYKLDSANEEGETLELNNITVDNCSAKLGGGISVVGTAVNLGETTSVSNCSATKGGAVYLAGSDEDSTTEDVSFIKEYSGNNKYNIRIIYFAVYTN